MLSPFEICLARDISFLFHWGALGFVISGLSG